MKAKKPIHTKSKSPTLAGSPLLGYLNSYSCPRCGKHLFAYYDGDTQRPDYDFIISDDWNYCSKCGQLLDLNEWKRKREPEEELVLED